MSTIADSEKIDLVTQAPSGEIKMIMVEVRPWEDVGLLEIQEKFKTYLAFIENGCLVESYPEAQGAQVIIRLDTVESISEEIASFLDVVKKEWLIPMGIELELGKLTI